MVPLSTDKQALSVSRVCLRENQLVINKIDKMPTIQQLVRKGRMTIEVKGKNPSLG